MVELAIFKRDRVATQTSFPLLQDLLLYSSFPESKLFCNLVRKLGRCQIKQLNDLFHKKSKEVQMSPTGVHDICSFHDEIYFEKKRNTNDLLLYAI